MERDIIENKKGQFMIKKIYSEIEDDTLLHIFCSPSKIDTPRTDIVAAEEFLQLAVLKYDKGQTFVPHKHVDKEVPHTSITQESWVVLKGKVKAILYDLNDEVLTTEILNEGDLSITFRGGHNYEILEEGTLVLEYKTGPYYGQVRDKEFIGD
jgi:hypothetical protein